jgi:hypothetical protein
MKWNKRALGNCTQLIITRHFNILTGRRNGTLCTTLLLLLDSLYGNGMMWQYTYFLPFTSVTLCDISDITLCITPYKIT